MIRLPAVRPCANRGANSERTSTATATPVHTARPRLLLRSRRASRPQPSRETTATEIGTAGKTSSVVVVEPGPSGVRTSMSSTEWAMTQISEPATTAPTTARTRVRAVLAVRVAVRFSGMSGLLGS